MWRRRVCVCACACCSRVPLLDRARETSRDRATHCNDCARPAARRCVVAVVVSAAVAACVAVARVCVVAALVAAVVAACVAVARVCVCACVRVCVYS